MDRRLSRTAAALRLLRIATVLARSCGPALARGLWERSWAPPARGLKEAAERLGPAFVKLGQFLSVRPDLLPPEVLAELEALQDAAAPVPASELLAVVEAELRCPAGRLFADFDPVPVASASVSQVHRARLPGGESVAVKVQRPGVAEAIRRDLELASRALARLAPLVPLRIDAAALGSEVLEAARAELDFRREAEAAEALARSFRSWEGIRVPRVHWGWTTRRVLTAEYVEGFKISDPRARGRSEYEGLAALGAKAFLKQVLDDGLFHADLHPANLLVTLEPRPSVCYLDFGIMGRLTRAERDGVLGALAGLLLRDAPLALRHLRALGVAVPAQAAEPFAREVGRVMDEALAPRLEDVSLARVGKGLLAAVYRHRVGFPRRYALLVKALLTVEGTARLLHPDFCFEAVAREYLLGRAGRTVTLGGLAEAAWRGLALLGVGALA